MRRHSLIVAAVIILLFAPLPALAQSRHAFQYPPPGVFSAGPLSNPQPPSTLLPAGATSFTLTLDSSIPTTCAYSVGKALPFSLMTPFGAREPATTHTTVITGLSADPATSTRVYIRCAADPDDVLQLEYRPLPSARPGFPRTANLWGSWNFADRGLPYASRIDLWMGAEFTPTEIRELRRLNPNCFILTSMDACGETSAPENYFLHDVNGKRIEIWPGGYRLNITRPEVTEAVAQAAYQKVLDNGLAFDGCFFDNFMMTQSGLNHDIFGNAVQIDADGDGKADDPAQLDAAWRAGIFNELRAWRRLMPWALAASHSDSAPDGDILTIFNGEGIGFLTARVIEDQEPFQGLLDHYNGWCAATLKPAITFVESAIPNLLAYGYGYSPQTNISSSTLAFAHDFYPYMRFGLALTLMNDGYFLHEIGDTQHGQAWWYDELDYELGEPLGPARRLDMGSVPDINLIRDGDFTNPLGHAWDLWIGGGCAATAQPRTTARISVTSTTGESWMVDFFQAGCAIEKNKLYDLTFQAMADRPRDLSIAVSRNSPEWDNFGLHQTIALADAWASHTLTFEASATTSDTRVQFLCGAAAGDVWLSNVQLKEHLPDVFRRDFTRGLVLLNGSRERRTILVGSGYAHLEGAQAPRYQYILDDDAGSSFSTLGPWQAATFDSGRWKAAGPYYHNWGSGCHTLAGGAPGEAQWDLALRAPGQYTIQAWWPAAPQASGWTTSTLYEVLAAGTVVSSATLDQSRGGDQWHTFATNLALDPSDRPSVRLHNAATTGTLVADALHVFSAERYNDGSRAYRVTLEPMDGIILRRIQPETGVKAWKMYSLQDFP